LDFLYINIFWQSDGHKRKYKLAKWNIISRPKGQGGLGIEVLELKINAYWLNGFLNC
jgi:hypothetical protein